MARGRIITTPQLIEDYNHINEVVFNNFLPRVEKIILGFNTGMTSCLGKYHYSHSDRSSHKISMSMQYYNATSSSMNHADYIQTLIHEMVHMYMNVIGESHVGHSREFCSMLKNCLHTYANHYAGSNISYKVAMDSHISRYSSTRVSENYSYTFECPQCGATFKYRRKSKWVKRMLNGDYIPHKCVGGVRKLVVLTRK